MSHIRVDTRVRRCLLNERIIEVGTGKDGVGCLISIRINGDGDMTVEAYRGTRTTVRVNDDGFIRVFEAK